MNSSVNFSTEALNNLFENMPDAFFQTDENGSINFVNNTFLKMFGFESSSEIIGKPSTSVYAHNEDREKIMTTLHSNNIVNDMTIKGLKKDGSTFWVSLNATKIHTNDGKSAGKQGFIRDISARIETEKQIIKSKERAEENESKFVSAFDNAGIGMCLVDVDGNFTKVNNAMTSILGYSKEDLELLKFQNITHPDDLHADLKLLNETLDGKRDNYQLKKRYYHNSGKIIHAMLTVSLVRNDKNEPQFFVSQIEDYTQLEEYIVELQKAKEKAEESERLKTAFLMNISHEIRTPMNGILGFINLLKDQSLSADEKNVFIDLINKSGDRLMETINDIVEISKIEAGLIEIHSETINIQELTQYYFNFFKLQVEEKNIDFKLKNTINQDINSDKHKLDGILTNLIKNAIKFTDNGAIEVGSYIEADKFYLYVSDTGVGIPQEKLKIIFDRFSQADMNLNSNYEGAGIGLSIVKSYVDALGGTIEVKSVLGQGSTFTVAIPFTPEVEPNTHIEEFKSTDLSNKHTIVVAEDDAINYAYIEHLLSEKFNLIHVTTGEDAVKICKETPQVSAVLMDIKMPGKLDGFEAVKEIREFNQSVSIIAQTAFGFSSDRKKALDIGCNDYLSKPFKESELLSKLQFISEEAIAS